MGAKRLRDSLGYETRDDALAFLAKNAVHIVSDVRIVAEDESVERLQASKDPLFYERKMSAATVSLPAAVVRPALERHQAAAIARVLGSSAPEAIKTLRAMASRYGVAGQQDDESVVRQRLQELGERAIA